MKITTPVIISGYAQWVYTWRARDGAPIHGFGEDFDSPYCPISFEVSNDAV